MRLALKIGDRLAEGGAPHSPAHALRGASTNVEFAAEEGVPLDRDVVVRWPVARSTLTTAIETARPAQGARHRDSAFGLLTIVPPERGAGLPALPRDLIVLLDTSGSMEGRPLEQAKKVTSAIVESLGESDSLELIEFSAAPRRWKAEPVRASARARGEALAWLEGRRAGGGTEMRDAIFEALRPLRSGSQRQVVLVSDGAIGFEGEAVAALREQLPATCRLHTVGVGSAVNRSLTMAVARAGRGVEVIVGLDEDPERGARNLIRRTAAPLVVGLQIGGSALLASAPERLPDLFAGAPVLVGLKLRPDGGDLWIRGEGGDGGWRESLRVPPVAFSEGNASIVSLFARELVEDLELRLAAVAQRDKAEALRKEIEQVGLDFAIATEFTSWVALSEETTVDPQSPTRRVRIPHQLPHGTSVEGLGLRQPGLVVVSARLRRVKAMDLVMPARAIAPAAPRAVRYMGPSDSFGDARGSSDAQGDDVRIGSTIEGDYASESDEMEGPMPLRGEVILLKSGELVVTITVRDTDFEWSPPREVEILWAHDITISAQVVPERTTRAGTIAVGQSLRISMRIDSGIPSGQPGRLRLRHDGRETEVILAG
jgi:Ca-activated chloride channel family protein